MSQKIVSRDESDAHAPLVHKLNLRRLEKIQRILQYGALLVLLVFIALIVVSALKLRAINREIDSKQQELTEASATLEQRRREIARLEEITTRLNETVTAIVDPTTRLAPEQAEHVEQTIEERVSDNVKQTPARVYIQIAREEQRQRAAEIVHKLQAEGFIVPGIENVGNKSPSTSELRYFQGKSVAQDIEEIRAVFRATGIKLDAKQLTSSSAHPRHYEIWFGDDF